MNCPRNREVRWTMSETTVTTQILMRKAEGKCFTTVQDDANHEGATNKKLFT